MLYYYKGKGLMWIYFGGPTKLLTLDMSGASFLDCSWLNKKTLMHTNATTTKPKDEITVILLHRMSNYPNIDVMSRQKISYFN